MAWHKHKIKQNVEMGTLKKYSQNSIDPNSPSLIASFSSIGNPMCLSAILDKSTISLIAVMVIFHNASYVIIFSSRKQELIKYFSMFFFLSFFRFFQHFFQHFSNFFHNFLNTVTFEKFNFFYYLIYFHYYSYISKGLTFMS